MLADLREAGVDGLLCLGDIVGYGADPGPVLADVASRAAAVVGGNHDHAAAGRFPLAWFNPHARRAAEWTAGRLGADELRYLAHLPLVLEHAGATLVHASPHDPGSFPYVVSEAEAGRALDACPTPLGFIGHSHLPGVFARHPDGPVVQRRGGGRTTLAEDARYLVNVGSVGQPRDGDPWAAYAVWDVEERWVEIRRTPYDTAEARRRILAAGLPRVLGDRLREGR